MLFSHFDSLQFIMLLISQLNLHECLRCAKMKYGYNCENCAGTNVGTDCRPAVELGEFRKPIKQSCHEKIAKNVNDASVKGSVYNAQS